MKITLETTEGKPEFLKTNAYVEDIKRFLEIVMSKGEPLIIELTLNGQVTTTVTITIDKSNDEYGLTVS